MLEDEAESVGGVMEDEEEESGCWRMRKIMGEKLSPSETIR